jgi:hypothetical protein
MHFIQIQCAEALKFFPVFVCIILQLKCNFCVLIATFYFLETFSFLIQVTSGGRCQRRLTVRLSYRLDFAFPP